MTNEVIDYNSQGIDFADISVNITYENCIELMERYRLQKFTKSDTKRLQSKLHTAFKDYYILNNHVHLRRPTDDIKRLKLITKKANYLLEALVKSNRQQKELISLGNDSINKEEIDRIIIIIQDLSHASEIASRKIPKTRTGDKPTAFDNLIINLHHIYQSTFDRKEVFTKDPNINNYEGPFVNFCDKCLRILDFSAHYNKNKIGLITYNHLTKKNNET